MIFRNCLSFTHICQHSSSSDPYMCSQCFFRYYIDVYVRCLVTNHLKFVSSYFHNHPTRGPCLSPAISVGQCPTPKKQKHAKIIKDLWAVDRPHQAMKSTKAASRASAAPGWHSSAASCEGTDFTPKPTWNSPVYHWLDKCLIILISPGVLDLEIQEASRPPGLLDSSWSIWSSALSILARSSSVSHEGRQGIVLAMGSQLFFGSKWKWSKVPTFKKKDINGI